MTGAERRIRPSRREIDRDILDITAGLIARRGVGDTAVQAVADRAGYSKAGILNRFSSKERLVVAALNQCIEQTEAIYTAVEGVCSSTEKDAAALIRVTDLALAQPGWAELALAAFTIRRGDDVNAQLTPVAAALLRMFGIDIDAAAATPLTRRAQVTGSLGAVLVLSLTYSTEASAEQARPLLAQVGWSALGYTDAFPSVD